MKKHALKLVLAIAAMVLPGLGLAMESPAKLTVLPGWRQADGTHMAAIRIDLDDGWKTYWRAPGDGGIPPFFDFLGSSNLLDYKVSWPAPKVYEKDGLLSVGYKHSVILPIRFTPQKTGRDIRLRGAVEIGVCEDICLPTTLEIDAVLPATATKKQPSISAALASVPFTAREAAVKGATCRLENGPKGLEILTRVQMPSAGGAEYVVLESANQDHWISQTRSVRRGEVLETRAMLASFSGGPVAINRSDIRITVLGSEMAVDIQGCTGG